MNRRTMLTSIAGVLAGVASQAVPGAAGEPKAELLGWLDAHLPKVDLGEIEESIRAAISTGRDATIMVILTGRRRGEKVSELLDRASRTDFERGRIIDVAGWRLALTDAQLLSLAMR